MIYDYSNTCNTIIGNRNKKIIITNIFLAQSTLNILKKCFLWKNKSPKLTITHNQWHRQASRLTEFHTCHFKVDTGVLN